MAPYQIVKHRICNRTGIFPGPGFSVRRWPPDNDHDINDDLALILCENTDICDTCFPTHSLSVMTAFLICTDLTILRLQKFLYGLRNILYLKAAIYRLKKV